MTKLKPWYKVVTPREDLREGKPLDASEFAVHLDQVRNGNAVPVYQNPELFFERTFLTKNLRAMSAEVFRRLSGENTETSAVFNMTTQFGGGKTHALTLLYHLANSGSKSKHYLGVQTILEQGKIKDIPKAATAVFVGQKFDPRGGDDGTPLRHTPWGEIAWQLAGKEGYRLFEKMDQEGVAPGGDTIGKLFKQVNGPVLILIDELLNYVSRHRKDGLSGQLYNFIQNLTEEARATAQVVVVASIPSSELEMTAEDQSDYTRFKKLLDRLGKAVIMAAESETSEIIRRRLFEWDPKLINQEGRVLLSQEAAATCKEYAEWIKNHRQQVPNWFASNTKEAFEATYPFHPMVLSVFERKWQELPRFQQTRGVLRLLALWVSNCYQTGFKGGQNDSLICLGSAPLSDSQFRAALFEQLGESRLEGAMTTDIAGKKDSNAVRLDQEAEETLKKAQIHKKVATVIFFESNGGQAKSAATVPEIRLDVAEPDFDIGNVETALEALTDACYYLSVERNQYRFSLKENLNKRFADRKAGVKTEEAEKIVLEEIQKVFPMTEGIERVFFPEKSGQISDRPAVTFVILKPEQSLKDDSAIQKKIEAMTKEYGTSSRTYKSALVWIVPDSSRLLLEEACKLMAWTDIEAEGLNLDEAQERQLEENIKKAKRDLRESVWRSYNRVMLLSKDNTIKVINLGLVTSSAAETMCKFILNHLRQIDEIAKDYSPRKLLSNWPPPFVEWSTQKIRDVFYASPQFPRLMNAEAVNELIARGVAEGHFAYVAKSPKGSGYAPFIFKKHLSPSDVEISDDVYLIKAEEAEKHIKPPELTQLIISPAQVHIHPGKKQTFTAKGLDQVGRNFEPEKVEWGATGGNISKTGVFEAGMDEGNFFVTAKSGKVSTEAVVSIGKEGKEPKRPDIPEKLGKLTWAGEIPAQKWMNFYTKILTRFVRGGNLKVKVSFEVSPENGTTPQQVEETRASLRELGLNDEVDTSNK